MIRSDKVRALFAAPYLSWAVIFIVVPLLMVFWYGFTDGAGRLSLANIAIITRPEYLKSLGLSMALSLVSTLLCLLIAYPLCLILTEKKTGRAAVIVLLFILPMWMNTLLRTMAWQTILEKTGILNTILRFLHLPSIYIINKPQAIVIGMVYNFLPYMVLPLYNALAKIDDSVIHAAHDLGADRRQTFLRVVLPLSVPGIVSGVTMVFIPALTTFVISQMLGGNKILLIGNIIEQEFTQAYDWNLGSGLSIILMIFIILNMVIEAALDRAPEK
ncbi:ABC transporter permease [Lachnoclostridium sp. Marseille-P6806]|uniref:ABC transporter permease n=1 Tax=Lachnoclostridium sp. Marseille-P6806 TaxID=2364793 RepID=UPI001F5F85E7|nr:ABC transporter permease [Lachnoclostridium sp. Marseille-P6806]